MKKSSIVLIITGVLCTIGAIICISAAAVMVADLGINLAQTTVNGHEFVWDEDSFWGCDTYDYRDDSEADMYASDETVEVDLPFLHVFVDGEEVEVFLPGINITVDEDTDKVHVKIGGEEYVSTDPSVSIETTMG